MSTAFKRVLTDELRESLAASSAPHHSTPDDDIAARLRSVGARVRKNVTEGYKSPPSFSKSISTGTIFQSARDTLRDAQGLHPLSNHIAAQKKRRRSQGDQGYDSDGAVGNDMDMDLENRDSDLVSLENADRPIKSLRKPRKGGMLTTRSLPIIAFPQGEYMGDVIMSKVEEEDWSTGDFAPQNFQAVEGLGEDLHIKSVFEP